MKITRLFSRGGAAKKQSAVPAGDASTDRFLGCLLGGAIGDALGSPVEIVGLEAIRRLHGPSGITTFQPLRDVRAGSITDDTQMTLFMAEGVLSSWARRASIQEETALACLHWVKTQEVSLNADVGRMAGRRVSRVALEPGMNHRRAPEKTCLDALFELDNLVDRATNNSKGCGSVMRMAPVGLCGSSLQLSAATTFAIASDCAATTHGHPTARLASSVFALLVQRLTRGVPLAEALVEAKSLLVTHAHHQECLRAIEKAERLAKSRNLSDLDAVHRLGEGWIAEETLAVGIYCALVAKDFREGVLMAVNHNGDSDSMGSVAGNLLGALHGASGIPSDWVHQVEMRELIREMAHDLHAIGHQPDETLRPALQDKWLSNATSVEKASGPGLVQAV